MLRGNWWEVFKEPELNALEDQLNINNQNIKAVFSELHGGPRPDCRGALAILADDHRRPLVEPVEKFRQSEQSPRQPTPANTSLEAPLDVSWTPDFWGKIRNEVREAEYAAQVSAADLEMEKLTEQASLAEYYFEIRGQDELQEILDQTVAADQKALDANQGAYDAGTGDYISVVEARATLKSAQASAMNVGLVARAVSNTPLPCCWARSPPTFRSP